MISFTVFGHAQSQGSSRAFMAGGRPVITSTNKNLGQWRRLVSDQAQRHARLLEGPVGLTLIFHLPRPKSLKKTAVFHSKRPDLDKLARATVDSLTGIMYTDDAQVCHLYATKLYAEPGENPRVDISVWEVR